jgi:ATP-dependent helicase/nuclease subunit A
MTGGFTPIDQAQRDRITRSLDETLFVEAGAGTGKTTALVTRIAELLASGRANIDSIAAITFTDAAASELGEKVRLALEALAQDPGRNETERERCLQATRGMERASIQTLHGFAGSLLRQRPLEAGLPPGFETVEEIGAGLDFERRWQEWLDQALEAAEIGPLVLKALSLGLRLDDLSSIARDFHRSYDLLDHPFPAAEEPARQAVQTVMDAAGEIRRLLPLARNGPDDPLASHAGRVAALADRLGAGEGRRGSPLSVLFRWGKLSFSRGRKSDWGDDPETAENGCTAMKDLLWRLEELKAQELEGLRRAALLPLLESLRTFVLGYVDERRGLGKAEFHDLLVWARDLLRDNREVRSHLRGRYSHILIDEFQDIDPIQAEIAFFLSGHPSADDKKNAGPADWTRTRIVPGKLFLVGDTKQSIYRFRRADIASLDRVRVLLGKESTPLVQNFRSQGTVISWVNALFEKWMTDDAGTGLQAPYISLSARWQPPEATPPLGVHWAGGVRKASAPEVRREESETVAALVRDIRTAPWSVREAGSTALRAARYQDICVLLPTRTGLPSLEQALDDAAIPYRVEGPSLVLGTQDVRDLLGCLRAIDAPADQVALVAALRSSAFACSDVELLEFVEDGGRLDYLDPGPAGGPVKEALDVLLRYHRDRVWEPPDRLIERFVRERRMVEACFGKARPRERWRRIRFVVDRSRVFAQVEGGSLRAFLDWIEGQAREGARMVEAPVLETDEDAVRIMTIHSSKGLEFPIVLLAGLGVDRGRRAGPVIFDRTTGSVEVRAGAFATAGYEDAQVRERAAEQAEGVRLMYVAATRARDHLIVSLFHPARAKGSPAAIISRLGSESDDLWHEVSIPDKPVTRELSTTAGPRDAPVDTEVDTEVDRAAWVRRREAVIQRASRPASLAVTTLARIDKEEAERGEVHYRRGRGGSTLGRAVHSVLQIVDLATGKNLEEISKAQAAAEGIADRWREVAGLARTGLDTPVVKQAVATGRYHREVFVSTPLEGTLFEGFVDLLFEDADGMTVVDYKTDALEAGKELTQGKERYAMQVGAYAMAVQRATGKPVRRVVLVFLHAGMEIPFDDVEEMMEAAEEKARESLAAIG